MISDILQRKKIAEEGTSLARRFAQRLPKERVGDAKRVAIEYDTLVGDAMGFQRKVNLGVVGKSAYVNGFQWALIAEGYSEDFAKEIGGQLAVTLAASN